MLERRCPPKSGQRGHRPRQAGDGRTLPRPRMGWGRPLVAIGLSLILVQMACGLPGPWSAPSGQTTSKTEETVPVVGQAGKSAAEPGPIQRRQRHAQEANGLITDLMDALNPERVQAIRAALGRQLGYRDRITLSAEDINRGPDCSYRIPLTEPVGPDGDGRSIFARLLELVEDADKLPLCNAEFRVGGHTYGQCELFKIDSLADFYLRSIAGAGYLTLHLSPDDALGRHAGNPPGWLAWATGSPMEMLTGLNGFEPMEGVDEDCVASGENCLTYRVSAEAANRMVFGTFDDRQDGLLWPSGAERTRKVVARPEVAGYPFDALHDGTLSAWECDGFLELIRPIVAAFVRHDRVDLMLASMRLLNQVWLADPGHIDALESRLAHMLLQESGAP